MPVFRLRSRTDHFGRQVPGLEDDLPSPPSTQNSSSELISEEPEDAEADEAKATEEGVYEVPGKSVRQMLVAMVPAAASVSAGLSCAWTSLGTLQADKASVWALDLSRQVIQACIFLAVDMCLIESLIILACARNTVQLSGGSSWTVLLGRPYLGATGRVQPTHCLQACEVGGQGEILLNGLY